MDVLNANLEPSILVIVGITGDLAGRKVLPAIYHLFASGALNEQTYIFGTSRQEIVESDVLDRLKKSLEEDGQTADQAVIDKLANHLNVLQFDPNTSSDYQKLRTALQSVEDEQGICLHRLFYLSIPPQVFENVVGQLGAHGLNKGCEHGSTSSRLLVEKPFGFDLDSARKLIAATAEYFDEDQVFRIDHYLAKETAQNILTFRSQNPLFKQVWHSGNISQISITATEALTIEGRANFYDNIGALRDLIQSHLMQLLSLTIMEVPAEITTDSVHAAKQQVLQSITPMTAADRGQRAIRGQYATYRDEVGDPNTDTETYASIVLFSCDSQWQNVPLRLTTGKALKMKRTSITIDFGDNQPNRLQLRIQPDEGITLMLQVKQPGLGMDTQTTSMDFSYKQAFEGPELDAYERVLIEAIRGDRLLFATDQEVLLSWSILEPLLQAWNKNNDDLKTYPNGSDGPDTTVLENLHHDT